MRRKPARCFLYFPVILYCPQFFHKPSQPKALLEARLQAPVSCQHFSFQANAGGWPHLVT